MSITFINFSFIAILFIDFEIAWKICTKKLPKELPLSVIIRKKLPLEVGINLKTDFCEFSGNINIL